MRNARTWATAALATAAAAALTGAAPAVDLPEATNAVTERGTLYVQGEDGGWDSYDPAAGTLTAAFPSQVAIEQAAAAGMSCAPDQPAVCYRPAATGLGIEQSDDAGVTWALAWQLAPGDVAALERDYSAAAGVEVELRTRAVAVALAGGGHVVVGANGYDGLVKRSSDGSWQRVGFPGVAEPVQLASKRTAPPSSYPWPVLWGISFFAVLPFAAGEARAWASGRRSLREALPAWALGAAGLAALAAAWLANPLSPVAELNGPNPGLPTTVAAVAGVGLLLAAALVRRGLPRGHRWAILGLSALVGLALVGVGSAVLAAGADLAVAGAVAFAAAGAAGALVWRESGRDPVEPERDPAPTPEWIPAIGEAVEDDPYDTPAPGTSIFRPVGAAADEAEAAATPKAAAQPKSSAAKKPGAAKKPAAKKPGAAKKPAAKKPATAKKSAAKKPAPKPKP